MKENKIQVKLANDTTINVVGKGTLVVHTKQGGVKNVKDTFFVSGLQDNLLSVG
jgi:hypothetical protein